MEARSESTPRRPTLWIDALALGLFVVSVGLFLSRERQLGLRFPVPWPDEGSFLWPALAFRDHSALFAPEIHPSRDAMWMPPGFMVLEGLLFRLLPFSLSTSRLVSALFVVLSFAGLGAFVARSPARVAHALLASTFFACPIVLLVGNVARMESLVLLVGVAGFVALERGRAAGLGLVALAPLVHPNGAFVAIGGFAYWAALLRGKMVARRPDVLVIVAAAAVWLLYGAYVARNLPGFLEDIGAQLRFKRWVSAEEGGAVARASNPVVLGSCIALLVSTIVSRRAGARPGAPAFLAAALLGLTVSSAGWLYEVYAAFAALLVSMLAVEAVVVALRGSSHSPQLRLSLLAGASALVWIVDLGWVLQSGFLARSLRGSIMSRPSPEPVYLTAEDRAAVGKYLEGVAARQPVTYVQFLPDAEALEYESLRSSRLRYVQPTFHQFRSDLVILHESVWFPEAVRAFQFVNIMAVHSAQPPPSVTTIRARDGTERWLALAWPPPRPN